MPTTLHESLAALAEAFASDVLAALRSASIQELAGAEPARVPVPVAIHDAHRAAAQPLPRSGAAAPRPVGRIRSVERSNAPISKLGAREVAAALDRVIALVKTSAGLKSEEIRARLGIDRSAMPAVIRLGVAGGKLKSRGRARGTTYTVC